MKRARASVLALLALAAGGACRRREPLRHLPFADAEMVSLGVEARPAQRISSENEISWTIPSSGGGKLELAGGLSPEEAKPGLTAVFRAYRVENGRRALLGSRTVGFAAPLGWTGWTVPWKAHRKPVVFAVEALARLGASPLNDPLAAPALLAEPVLVPRAADDPPRGENAVIFLIDTLRADRLGCYGDRAAATPEIDRLAREGVRVERVVSSSNWTLPAHASLFTSTPVSKHQTAGLRRTLGKELPTLAETLQARGYRTIAVTNGGFVDPLYGLARGFDRYFSIDIQDEDVGACVSRALKLLRAYRGEPVFLFFHTFEVHDYIRHLGVPLMSVKASAELLGRLSRRYDEDIAVADAAFGDFRSGLARLGLARRTAILLTSDHGEMINDRPETITSLVYGHTHPYLHEEENRIPLIVGDPSHPGGGRVLAGPASLLDVAPTLLETVGLPPNPAFEGVPISRLARDPDFARSRPLVTEEPHNECLSVEKDGRKLILRPARPFNYWWIMPYGPLPSLESYDLRSDPGEKRDLGERLPDLASLRSLADETVARGFPGSLVVRVPARAPEVSLSFRAESGIRRAVLFGARARDGLPTLDASGIAREKAASGDSALWVAVEPRRERDRLQVEIAASGPLRVAFGDGTTLDSGEKRSRWEALLRGKGPVSPSSLLLYASSLLRPAEDDQDEAVQTPESLERLRSLGYLNAPSLGRESASRANLPPAARGRGADVLIVRHAAGGAP